ncbi:MAG TPA: 1,2-phenylacetyl-CoA epoxidase subunit PaaD [Actinospica sp.]|nr:1,2-phenylacetyl-CoA epoxidase subunit PaaD [Actinospica sp.]
MGSVRTERSAREIVADVPDPEMPWVTLGDLGIVRGVVCGADKTVRVELTPTYLGCPAIDAMRADVVRALDEAGYRVESVDLRLDPPWTSAAITGEGRRKLAEAGIAPPPHVSGSAASSSPVPLSLGVRCPHCGGVETALLSRFGASPCQELRRCSACAEPFPAVRS